MRKNFWEIGNLPKNVPLREKIPIFSIYKLSRTKFCAKIDQNLLMIENNLKIMYENVLIDYKIVGTNLKKKLSCFNKKEVIFSYSEILKLNLNECIALLWIYLDLYKKFDQKY